MHDHPPRSSEYRGIEIDRPDQQAWLALGGRRLLRRRWRRDAILTLDDAFLLFRRLGVDVQSLSAREFTLAYFDLAKRYHPDFGNRTTHDLMANINAARTMILRSYRKN